MSPRALPLLLALGCGPAGDPAPTPEPTEPSDPPATTTSTTTSTTTTTPPADATVTVADGEDWSLPSTVVASADAGLFSEAAAPDLGVDVHVVDVTWAMLEPSDDQWATDRTGGAEGMPFRSFDEQMAQGGRYWLRIWTSGTDWAPSWVQAKCGVRPISGKDYDGQQHLPIWDPCVWSEIVELYREFLVNRGLLADPDLVLAYVPGAFTWTEFDFDMVNLAVAKDGLDEATFNAWFHQMTADLAGLDPAHAGKLAYTGEDYPYGPFGADDDLYARDAVAAGLGIRNGITEVSNDHLSEVPAWGFHVDPDGHLAADESWPAIADPGVVTAAENECFDDCGFHADDPAYAVRQANLKALQLRTRWLYVVPGPSYMKDLPDLWTWTRLELGRTALDAPDAWVQLRDAEDRYWADEGTGPGGVPWDGFPYIKNLERWIVQRDVAPDGISRRGTEVHTGELDPYNGTAYEGRRTDHANGSDWLYLFVDPAFSGAETVKVTWRDTTTAAWSLEYDTAAGPRTTPIVTGSGDGAVRTATFALPGARFAGGLAGGADLRIYAGGAEDLEVTLVRVVR